MSAMVEAGPPNWRCVAVSDAFLNGMQFFRWTEDGCASIVRLRVDKDGYILWWTDAVNSECISLCSVMDVRCGRMARQPKDSQTLASCYRFIEAFSIQNAALSKCKRSCSSKVSSSTDLVASDSTLSCTGTGTGTGTVPAVSDAPPSACSSPSVDPRMAIDACAITVLYGADSVNPDHVNFIAPSAESAKEWAKFVLEVAYRSLKRHGNMVNFLEMAYKELGVTHSERGKIPLKLLYRKFVQHRDDQEKVENVLEACGLPTDKAQTIRCADLTGEAYRRVIKMLLQRNDVDHIFIGLGAQTKPYLHITAEQFVDFMNKEQRDPRLNEVLHPFCTVSKAEELIRKFEPTAAIANKRHLSIDGFYEFLISDDNTILPYDVFERQHDMHQPLAHYFINSSHNTYLTGHQLTGKSSVDYYRYVLLTGCRCIELDCWDGDPPDDEPKITHGYTMVTQISFKDVMETIAACAFEVSEYPLILSFENHCSAKQQAKMVQYMKAVLGDMLLSEPLSSHPLEPGVPLPSPSQLRRKVIVKSKKSVYNKEKKNSSLVHVAASNCDEQDIPPAGASPPTPLSTAVEAEVFGDLCDSMALEDSISFAVQTLDVPAETRIQLNPGASADYIASTTDTRNQTKTLVSEEANAESTLSSPLESTANFQSDAPVLAALVNYVDPVPFASFAQAESRQCSFESFSFVETQASQLLKMHPVEFVNYNKVHLSRMYPKGTRVDSSNFIPQLFWNAGLQMASLNFQTPDLGLQLNWAMFDLNGRCGFVLKPDFMRRSDQYFDPFTQTTVDGIVAASLTVKIISGQFLSDRKVGTFIEVELYGVPHDTRRKQRTKMVPTNALNPVYEENEFEFSPIIVPQLAFLRLAAYDETNRLLGQRIMPVSSVRPGYRHVPLRNEVNQPAGLATLFVRIRVRDYVPTRLVDFAEALVNPIAHQHLREQQMALLTDELVDEEVAATCSNSTEQRSQKNNNNEKSSHVETKRTTSNGLNDSRRKEPRSTPTLILPTAGIREALLSPLHTRKCPGKASDLPNLIALARRKSNTEVLLHPTEAGSADRSPAESPMDESKRRDLNSTQDKLAATVSGNKILQFQDTVWKDMLPDSSVFSCDKVRTLHSFEDLKSAKEVQKLFSKLEKERHELAKRHEKSRQELLSEYGMQRPNASSKAAAFARRLTSATVNAMTLAKTSRAERRRETQQEITVDFDSAPTESLYAVNPAPSRASLPGHTAVFTLRCAEIDRQYAMEANEWQKSASERLSSVVAGILEEKFRQEQTKLSSLYDEEMARMQAKQDRLRRDTNRQLSKDVHNKTELSRSRQESLLQHIHYGVLARQQLSSIYERERDSLTQKQVEMKRLIDAESVSFVRSISALYEKSKTKRNSTSSNSDKKVVID